ncbi:MAG: hypothetical protein AAGC68_07225 [Verrucomicrobiota bacterium]
MNSYGRWLTLLLAGAPLIVSAQVVERSFVVPSGVGIETTYVLQGSKNMRRLGKGDSLRKDDLTIGLPATNPVTVLSPLKTPELQPTPRFGYGSDWSPEVNEFSNRSREHLPRLTSSPIIAAGPYRTQARYPFDRYWYPSWSFRSCSPWTETYSSRFFTPSCGGSVRALGFYRSGRFSLFFGW